MRDEWFDEGPVRGHWGTRGSGILYTDGKAIFLMLRSSYVQNHPNTWSIPGGAVPVNRAGAHMDDWKSAQKEMDEEAGGLMVGKRITKVQIKTGPFRYTTFVVKVTPKERRMFTPTLNWENTAWAWFEQDDLIGANLHPGFSEALTKVYGQVFSSPKKRARESVGSHNLFDLDAELGFGSSNREDPAGYVAMMDSRSFSFLGFGKTEPEAHEAIARAWTGKGRSVGAEPQTPGRERWRRQDTSDPRGGTLDWYGVQTLPVWDGTGYEDEYEVPPPPSIRRMKKGKK